MEEPGGAWAGAGGWGEAGTGQGQVRRAAARGSAPCRRCSGSGEKGVSLGRVHPPAGSSFPREPAPEGGSVGWVLAGPVEVWAQARVRAPGPSSAGSTKFTRALSTTTGTPSYTVPWRTPSSPAVGPSVLGPSAPLRGPCLSFRARTCPWAVRTRCPLFGVRTRRVTCPTVTTSCPWSLGVRSSSSAASYPGTPGGSLFSFTTSYPSTVGVPPSSFATSYPSTPGVSGPSSTTTYPRTVGVSRSCSTVSYPRTLRGPCASPVVSDPEPLGVPGPSSAGSQPQVGGASPSVGVSGETSLGDVGRVTRGGPCRPSVGDRGNRVGGSCPATLGPGSPLGGSDPPAALGVPDPPTWSPHPRLGVTRAPAGGRRRGLRRTCVSGLPICCAPASVAAVATVAVASVSAPPTSVAGALGPASTGGSLSGPGVCRPGRLCAVSRLCPWGGSGSPSRGSTVLIRT